jgi:hypothetical protein
MIIHTTATNSDWVWNEIEIPEPRVDEFLSKVDTPELYTFYQQGLAEGWITVID